MNKTYLNLSAANQKQANLSGQMSLNEKLASLLPEAEDFSEEFVPMHGARMVEVDESYEDFSKWVHNDAIKDANNLVDQIVYSVESVISKK